jgi:hypothetical protein
MLLKQSLRVLKEPDTHASETHVSETQCHVSEWVGGWAHGYQRSGTPAPLLAAAGSQSNHLTNPGPPAGGSGRAEGYL